MKINQKKRNIFHWNHNFISFLVSLKKNQKIMKNYTVKKCVFSVIHSENFSRGCVITRRRRRKKKRRERE